MKHVAAVMVATGRIAAEHESFNCICQVAPICTPIEYKVPQVNASRPQNGISIGSAIFAYGTHQTTCRGNMYSKFVN